MPTPLELPCKTVLCVDDDVELLSALRRLLRPLQYKVLTATNGEECLALVKAIRPQVIIMDVNMPKVNGREALRRLKADGFEDIPVVMLTAESDPEDILDGYGEGCVYYITKPFKNEYVRNVVEYLIGDLDEETRRAFEQQL